MTTLRLMPGLFERAQGFVEAALALLAERCDEEREPVRGGFAEWAKGDEQDLFVMKAAQMSALDMCLLANLSEIEGLAESEGLVEALGSNAEISPQLGQLVGSTFGSYRVEAQPLAMSLISGYVRDFGLSYDSETFAAAFEKWWSNAVRDSVVVEVRAPLLDLEFSGAVALEDGLEIAQMNDAEILRALQLGVIRPTVPGMAHVSSRAAVRTQFDVPRRIGSLAEADYEAANRLREERSDLAESVLWALRVFKPGRVQMAGIMFSTVEHGGLSTMSSPIGSAGARRGAAMDLSNEEAADFAEFWTGFRVARGNKPIDGGIRRCAYAGDRHRDDDRLVDLIIATESLLLSDAGKPSERGEMRFRASLRGAVFIEVEGYGRRQILRQLRRGYDVRSSVVHGGSPDPTDLKNAAGESVELPVFTDEIEVLVRTALHQAIDRVRRGEGWPPDWDELALS